MSKQLPRGWQEVKLQECLLEQPKYGMNAPAVKYDNLLPTYIRITDIDEYGNFIDGNKVSVNNDNYKEYILHKNDFLFARTGASVGKTYLYNEKDGLLVFAGYLIKVVPNQNKLNSLFLKYYTQSKRYWDFVKTTSARTGQPGINGKEYANMNIILPPLDEQKRIAYILSTFDDLIENLKKLIEKKELYKKGVMQRVLTGEVRFNGFTDEWETMPLCKILEERKTFQPKDGNLEHVSLTKEGVVPKSERYERDFLVKDKNKQYKITKINDICYNPANLKFGVICKNNYGEGIFSPIYVTFEVNKGFNIDLISYILKSESFINNARRYEEGTVYERKAVSPENLLSIKIKIPSLEEQNKIAELLTLIDKDIEILKQLLHLRKLQKKGVMQKLLTGEVRI